MGGKDNGAWLDGEEFTRPFALVVRSLPSAIYEVVLTYWTADQNSFDKRLVVDAPLDFNVTYLFEFFPVPARVRR